MLEARALAHHPTHVLALGVALARFREEALVLAVELLAELAVGARVLLGPSITTAAPQADLAQLVLEMRVLLQIKEQQQNQSIGQTTKRVPLLLNRMK